jgi:hypothetical protein
VPVTLLGAGIAALALKRHRPAVYAAIGGLHPEDGHIPVPEPADDRVAQVVHR